LTRHVSNLCVLTHNSVGVIVEARIITLKHHDLHESNNFLRVFARTHKSFAEQTGKFAEFRSVSTTHHLKRRQRQIITAEVDVRTDVPQQTLLSA
jgi:hypothetical protein